MSDFTVKALILAGVVGGLVLLYWGISELFGWWQWKNYKESHPLPPAMPPEWYGTTKSLDDIQSAMGPLIAAEVRRAKLKIERGESIFTVPGLFCYGCPELKDFFHEVRGCVTCPFKMAQELEELRKYKAQKEKEAEK
jgi:hypothetical protein|nr:MAG TPA: Glucitol operon activator protein (GutM) [Caudoviricetes sp.]